MWAAEKGERRLEPHPTQIAVDNVVLMEIFQAEDTLMRLRRARQEVRKVFAPHASFTGLGSRPFGGSQVFQDNTGLDQP